MNIYERHPDFAARVSTWQLLWESYVGGDEYIHQGNLFQHSVEENRAYLKRLRRAYYYNYCKPIINIYNQFVYSAHVNRVLGDTGLEDWVENTNGKGKTIDQQLSIANKHSAIFGTTYAVIDVVSDNTPPVATAVVKQSPLLKILKPFAITNWSLDDNGEYNWVEIKTEKVMDADMSKARTSEPQYIVWGKSNWWVIDKDGAIVKEGINQLGVVPIVPINHYPSEDEESVLGEALIEDIARTNRALFNWCSLLDEIIYEQTFSILVVQARKQDKSITLAGTQRAFTYEWGANVPQFISPDASQAKVIVELANKTIKEIYRQASLERSGMVYKSEVSQSGVSKEWDLIDTNQAIASKASVLADAELTIEALAYGWEEVFKGHTPFASVQELKNEIKSKGLQITYPKQFDTRSFLEELDKALALIGANISLTFNKEYKKNLATRALPNISQDKLTKIHTEIEEKNEPDIIHKEGVTNGEGSK